MTNTITFDSPQALPAKRKISARLELGVISLILVLVNWRLLWGSCNSGMVFLPEFVRHGEWWRLFTHPFVHVTWFHLLLDGTAFFLLYLELQEEPFLQRVACTVASAAGSLLISIWADPNIATKGLCGLSGTAHGLMVISSLNLITQSREALTLRIGMIALATVLIKCLIEVVTGKMLFQFLYFGMVGDPVAVTHAGGALGGAFVWLGFYRGRLGEFARPLGEKKPGLASGN